MRVHILVAGMTAAFLVATGAALGQGSLHSTTGGLDPSTTESSLLPVSGFSLDGPAASDANHDETTAEPRPSEGLRLQIYDLETQSGPPVIEGGEGSGLSPLGLP